MLYNVIYSARKNGAIGIFYPVDINVEADNFLEARNLAFERLHESGWETNHPIKITEIITADIGV